LPSVGKCNKSVMKYFSTKLALVIIITLAAALRFWHLSTNPPSLFIDEVSNGYNAYSILKTARDEYGTFMPLTFRAFGDYNPALSVYTLVPSIALFGLDNFAVRFPSAFLGTISVLTIYFLVKKLIEKTEIESKNKELIPLLSSFFLATSPWAIQFSRYDHEANFMLAFILIALTFFLYSAKKIKNLIFSSIFFGLAFNTYHGAKVLVPAIVILLIILFYKQLLSFKKLLIIPIIIFFISGLPIILGFKNSLIRGESVGILNSANPLDTFVKNYISHYSPNFLFTTGDTIGRHSVSGMGELYVFQIPLLIIGVIAMFRTKWKNKGLLIGLFAVSAIPPALATPAPHALRGILFAPLWATLTAIGVASFLKLKLSKLIKISTLVALTLVGIYNFATYLHLYYSHYPKLRARDWSDGYEEMVKYVDSIKDNYSEIALTDYYGQPYIFVLFYSKYDPKTYQTQGLAKYEFFGGSWQKTKPGEALLITPPWQSHPNSVLKNIYAINGDLTFTVSETDK